MRCVELDPDLLRVARGQDLPCGRLVEAVAAVERDRPFDGFNRIVVEERAGAGGFHQRWRVERVVAWPAEPVVQRDLFAAQLGRLVGQICDAGIEVGVAEVAAAEIRARPGVRVAQIALAQPIVEEDLLAALRDAAFERERQREVLLPAERQRERLERIELFGRRQPEIHPGNAIQRPGEMLDDGAGRERPERAVARRAVPRPARARALLAVDRGPHRQHVRHAAHDELVLQVVETVQILEDQAELAHQLRVLEVLPELGVGFGHEQRVVRRQRGDKGRVEREIIFRRMACPAGPAVATEGFVEEDLASLCNRVDRGRGRRLAGREDRQAGCERAEPRA